MYLCHVFPAMCAYTQKDSLPPRESEWERLLHFCYYFSLFFFSCQGRLFPLLLCCRGWLGCMSPGKGPYTSSSLQSSSSPPLSAILARSVSHFCFATKIAKEGKGKQRKSGRKEQASPLLHSPTFATTLPCISFKISSPRDEEKTSFCFSCPSFPKPRLPEKKPSHDVRIFLPLPGFALPPLL